MKPSQRLPAIILVVVVGWFAADVVFKASASQGDAEFAARARQYRENRSKNPPFSDAILVASKGRVLFREAYGMADFELGVPLRPDHVFRIGSLTKPLTATAILKLRDQGRLKLSQSVRDYRTSSAIWRLFRRRRPARKSIVFLGRSAPWP